MSMNGESSRNMERETYPCPLFKKPKISATVATPINPNLKMKTQLCRRFRHGVCFLGSQCNYAHGFEELRRPTTSFQEPRPKLCRMFSQNKHCTYGHACRFLHSTVASPNNWHSQIKGYSSFGNVSRQSQLGKLDGYSSAEYKMMQTSTAATIDGYSSAEYRTMQTSTTATNASTSILGPSSLHKNEPYGVKCIFKTTELQKISRIYADWI